MAAEKGFVFFLKQWAKCFNVVGYAGCALMLCLSVIDIVGSKFFLWPLPGGADVIGLTALLVAAFPIASTELSGGHVRLDIGLAFLPKRAKTACQRIGNILGVFLFVLIILASMKYAMSLQRTGEASMTVAIPLFPFAYAIALSCIPTLLVLVLEVIKPEKVQKEVDKI